MADDAVANRTTRRDRLAQRRKALGLTQEDLAALLGVERTTVVRWERGENEPLPWIRPKLARALLVTAERLDELLASAAPRNAASPDRARDPADPPSPRATPGRDGVVPAAPRQLPATATGFTGRTAELKKLTRMLDDSVDGAPGTVVISAIGGTAGVGKTALALHWAHQVVGRFSDGQLYVNLRGFDPSGAPASPAEAIRGFLAALGVPPDKIPPAPDAQAGLYRSLVADRKMLIVLDNARDEQQVRPLLPASPASLVLITSRNQLAGLAAADGARLLPLDVLPHDEAMELLTARIGADRADAEPDAIAEIAGLCACLPLALAIAAARAIARPRFPLAGLAADLRNAAGQLDALDAGDSATSVRAVFSWSYSQLSTEAARMFRLLALHPGPDIGAPAAASLAAVDGSQARRLLRELTHECLLTEYSPGRYAFHDLLRAYAADQARSRDSEPERAAAVGRTLDHYLHTGRHGIAMLLPVGPQIALARPRPGTAPEQPANYQQAMAWFEAEHQVLLSAIALAAGSGFDSHAWQLPWAISQFQHLQGHYHESAASQRTALAAATRLGDDAGQATSSRLLANACIETGRHGEALGHYMTSLQLYRRLGDSLGEIGVLRGLARVAERQGRYADALAHSEHALRLGQAIGDKAEEAEDLNNVGWSHALLGDHQQARAFCRRALTVADEAGSRFAEYHAWDSLGYVEHQLGNFGEAAACYRRALTTCREIGSRSTQVGLLTHIGDASHSAGDLPGARQTWREALAILEDLGHPDAHKVRAKLAGLRD